MRVLVCNDDGFHAPGLALLAEAAQVLTEDVWIIAPDHKWTAASHQLSFDRDVTLTRVRERAYVCSGAPADCVVAAMAVLFVDELQPDLVLAGVNDKRNVGEDVAYSGTMAIAREATFWGVPAIALSQADSAPLGCPEERLLPLGGTARSAKGVHLSSARHELPVVSRLLQMFWQSRDQWALDGHWLSVSLPALLPAPVAQACIGRDKIAGECEVRERTPERITYRIRRERPKTATPGDENDRLADGLVAVVRHRWDADAPMPEAVIAEWSKGVTESPENELTGSAGLA